MRGCLRQMSGHLVTTASLYSSLYRFRLGRGTPNTDTEPDYWNGFSGLCWEKGCRRHLGPKDGLFCANFSSRRENFVPCRRCWCPPCFRPLGVKPFLVRKQIDDEGNEVVEPGGQDRFLVARKGDHLITPFQCDLCHFRNIQGRNPSKVSAVDRELLDSSTSEEPSWTLSGLERRRLSPRILGMRQ
jgi:hypothetical protein